MKWLPLHLRRQLHLSTYMYKIINGLAPAVFISKFAYVSGGTKEAELCNLYVYQSLDLTSAFHILDQNVGTPCPHP